MKKFKKYARRCGVLMVALIVLASSFVVPASASSSSDASFNLLDYYTLNNSLYQSYTGELPMTLRYTLPDVSVNFVDITVRTNIADIKVFVDGKRLATYLISSDNGYFTYRIADYLSKPITAQIKLGVSGSSGDFIQFERFLINYYFIEDLGCAYTLNSSGYTESVVQEANGKIHTAFTQMDSDLPLAFNLYLWPDDANKYDYIDVFIYYQGYGVDSISVSYDDTFVPFEASYTSDTYMTFGEKYIMLRLDLSSIERISGIDPLIRIAGSYDSNYTGYLCVDTVVGVYVSNAPDSLSVFFDRLKLFLSNLFGGDDPAVEDAFVTQEEINVSVNNQLVGAVEDWNTHIEVVETGYDLAFTKTTPALNWIASLANSVYSNLGWFGKLYLLIGLISVFMLVLSKSGLSRKIGSSIRRSG